MPTTANIMARSYIMLGQMSDDLAGQTSGLGAYSPLSVNAYSAVNAARGKLESRIKNIIANNPSDPIIQELEMLT